MHRCQRSRAHVRPRRVQHHAIELDEARRDPLPRLAAKRARQRMKGGSFLRNHVEDRIEVRWGRRHACPPGGHTFADTIEMLGEAAFVLSVLDVVVRRSGSRQANTNGTTPCVERIQDVVFAEIDLHRPPSGAFGVVPHEVRVNALARNLEGNSLGSPSAYTLERRPHDPDEVPIVLPTEIRFDFATVLQRVHRGLFLSHTIRRPCSVRSGSTRSMRSTSGAMIPASPPVAMHTEFCPSSARMRFTSPSTRPMYP